MPNLKNIKISNYPYTSIETKTYEVNFQYGYTRLFHNYKVL